eukprot:CAMPEP_0183781808 /NCGR_PEP_ID=MMETSP0739-20130205/59570_1 /TAXON_ID=385413 /ORGANISM="Thalassiosira miniscula, Strain CCMP1093" /LENGTH=48 /DNA_ID= /DNA_START= /DNA_END= /DNA_ORIENTATION=
MAREVAEVVIAMAFRADDPTRERREDFRCCDGPNDDDDDDSDGALVCG